MSSNWRLDGYKVLVTGSTKGIGYATAKEFVSLGAEVMVNGRSAAEVDAAVAALGDSARGCVAGGLWGGGGRYLYVLLM
jgi:NAD(P)-dependent dehydrogenase (short-subunit alcohol dehydrogenase family)